MDNSRFKQQKKPNKIKLIILFMILLGILSFWLNAESLLSNFFG